MINETNDLPPAAVASEQSELSPEQKNAALARYILNPASRAATTLQEMEGWQIDSYTLSKELEKITTLKEGDLSRAEEMLMSQGIILDGIFNSMIRAALAGGPSANIDTCYLDLALRSQKQARQTVETLKALREKIPPLLFSKTHICRSIRAWRRHRRGMVTKTNY